MRFGICDVKVTAVNVDSTLWKADTGLKLMLRELKYKSNNKHEMNLKGKDSDCYFGA
jgi:hypothetical protein